MEDVKGNCPLECDCCEQWAESASAPPSGALFARCCLPPPASLLPPPSSLSEVSLSAPKPPALRPHGAAHGAAKVLTREAYPKEKPPASGCQPNSSPLSSRCLYCCDGLGGATENNMQGSNGS